MEMSGEYRIPATPEDVWRALNDPETLKACLPGCQELERSGDNEFSAVVVTKVGPVKAKFKGSVELSNIRENEGYTITGAGKGGAAGFAKGSADVVLEPDGGETILKYVASAQIGGKLASVGSRLIDSVAKKNADAFFGAFSDHMSG